MLIETKKVIIKSDEQRLVFAEVYAPMQIDSDDETMTAEEIEKMAHQFLKDGNVNKIDVMHSFQESGCHIVESFIARKGDPDGFREGSWVMGVHIVPDDLWEAVKKGEINCFSFAGVAKGVSATVKLAAVQRFQGETEISDDSGLVPPHTHKFDLKFDDGGKIINGKTSDNFSHLHVTLKVSATEIALDHAHRILTIE